MPEMVEKSPINASSVLFSHFDSDVFFQPCIMENFRHGRVDRIVNQHVPIIQPQELTYD